MSARCVPHPAFPPQSGNDSAAAASNNAVRDMMAQLMRPTHAGGPARSMRRTGSMPELEPSEREWSPKRPRAVAQLSDAEKQARRCDPM